jgi:hypothetical protein
MGMASPQPPGQEAADEGDGAADQSQQQREPDEGGKHPHRLPQRVHRGQYRWSG